MPSQVVDKVCRVQEIFSVAHGYVDCISGAQRQNTRHPCRNADSAVTAERDVGTASMFQQINHGAKIVGFGCLDVLSLEKRKLLNVGLFTAVRCGRTIFSCRLAEHLSEDMIEAGDHDRIACKFVELRIGYACGEQSVDMMFGNVHQAEALTRSKFSYPVFDDCEIIVLPFGCGKSRSDVKHTAFGIAVAALEYLDFALTALVAVKAGSNTLNRIDAPTMRVFIVGFLNEIANLYNARFCDHAVLLHGSYSIGNVRTQFDLLKILPRCIGAAAHGAAARV